MRGPLKATIKEKNQDRNISVSYLLEKYTLLVQSRYLQDDKDKWTSQIRILFILLTLNSNTAKEWMSTTPTKRQLYEHER